MTSLKLPTALALLWLVPALPAPAQDVDAPTLAVLTLVTTELVVPPAELRDGWLELTPLAGGDEPPAVTRLGERREDDEELRLRPVLEHGAAMLCSGGEPWGVVCEQIYLYRGLAPADQPTVEIEVRFEPGMPVIGRYLLDDQPVAGARVAVVPAGLETWRGFTMPLASRLASRARGEGGEAPEARAAIQAPRAAGAEYLTREVRTDAEGRFELPPLAEGEYFLESILPSGRVHRGDPFLLPVPAEARLLAGVPGASEAAVTWDLGDIDVADGLVVRFQAADDLGQPLGGARVAGRQGDRPENLISYETAADRQGIARLSGFSVERPVHLSCHAPGHRGFEHDYAIVPVLVDCALERLAVLTGEVLSSGGLPVLGATVRALPEPSPFLAPEGAVPATEETSSVDLTARFHLGELVAGDYRLSVAAPGYEIEERLVTLAPGQRLELESIVLLRGRTLAGVVVDAKAGTGLPGAKIDAVSPPGAAAAVAGEDGAFELVVPRGRTLEMRLTAEGYAAGQLVLTPAEIEAHIASDDPLRLELRRGGRIRAVVWDEALALPCQGCRLQLSPGGHELLTDGWGEATSEPLEAGFYYVSLPRLIHLGSTVIEEPGAERRNVRVRVGKTTTVRFGERRRDVRVLFRPPAEPAWTLTARTPTRRRRVHRQTDGSFRVGHRPGESQDLYLHVYDPASGTELEVYQGTLPAAFEGGDLVLERRAGEIRGKAVVTGQPLAGERVRLRALTGEIRAELATHPDGSFRIPFLPAGVYSVWIGQITINFASLYEGQHLDLGTFELQPRGF